MQFQQMHNNVKYQSYNLQVEKAVSTCLQKLLQQQVQTKTL